MSVPKVSVIMPLFNTPTAHLKEAIGSILAQTFSDFELLIINDSPENKTLDKVVSSYDDKRIRYFKNKKNQGLEFSTNILISKSRGEYVAIFDHDDVSLPERLKQEVDYLDSNADVGVVSAQFTVFGKEAWTSSNPASSEEIKQRLTEVSCVSHTAMMVRKSIFLENNLKYEKDFFPAASYRMITRLALVTNIHNLQDVLLRYRMDGNNTSLKYASLRIEARQRVSLEYREGLQTNSLREKFNLDSVESFHVGPQNDERRYYKAIKGSDTFFVKSGLRDYEHEYMITERVFNKNKKYFAEPVSKYTGEINYFFTKWIDGVGLDDFLKNNVLTDLQKESFLQDLSVIYKTLYQERVVHRDIIPRNFMVIDNHLVLIDFYWAVEYDNYEEYDYVRSDIVTISLLGEDFASNNYTWDDAYSFVKIAEYISNKDTARSNKYVSKISENINKRVITPNVAMFHNYITKQSDQIDELYRRLTENQDKNTKIMQQNKDIQVENTKLEYQLADIQSRNIELTGSWSWRITRPLRFAKRAARWLFYRG